MQVKLFRLVTVVLVTTVCGAALADQLEGQVPALPRLSLENAYAQANPEKAPARFTAVIVLPQPPF